MPAYLVQETGDWMGGVVFAKNDITARKIGAGEYNDGELAGMSVRRRKDLDKYEGVGVPARILIAEGWYFECSGCGMHVDETALEDEGLPVDGVVGTVNSMVFCCHSCRMIFLADQAGKKAFGDGFLDMLWSMVNRKFGNAVTRDNRCYAYVPYAEPFVVQQASVDFTFPGQVHGPASINYRVEYRHNGTQIIGPTMPYFMCCGGDREAFEKFAQEYTAQ